MRSYELHTHPAAIALLFDLKFPPEISARYNIAPTPQVPVVRLTNYGEHELSQVRWGRVPFYAHDRPELVAVGDGRARSVVVVCPECGAARPPSGDDPPGHAEYLWNRHFGIDH